MRNIIFLIIAGLFTSCSFQKSITSLQSFDDIEYPYQVKKVQLSDEIVIAYADEGKGDQTIIFIHGLGSYMPAWKKNISVLKNNYRCIAIDLPGYGKSSKAKYDGSMQFYARVVSQFIDALALKNVVLAGHSMGGQISITAALAFPDKINKLILAAPAGFEQFDKGQKQWFREVFTPDLVKFTSVEAIKTNLAFNFYNMPDDATFMIKDRIEMRSAKEDFAWYCYIVPENVKGMVNAPVFDYLKDIKQPVLTLFGKYDNLIPNRYLNGGTTEKYAREGAEHIPDCQLIMVDKAGHFVQFEQPDVFNQAVIEFLK
jgi:pimeloyl-ACP methyl ester carboxylesterase